ncbi:LrgB family protein [Roseburia sp. 499]|uniref:LrgB family protein n=1 Tax=Roseburia sp. 499 TaxID=1261634 RepID=UPI000951B965|nr:LrgB family protein [Roseburia sp. 499]WVK69801.1 LrgB family protein [Roseburia sp. 499]
MNSLVQESIFFGMAISLLGYEVGILIKKKLRMAIFNPLLIAVVVVILFLVVFHVDYETYNSGAKYLSYLLTPATVCLAVPLYQQLHLLRKNAKAVIIGISSGVITSLTSVLLLSKLFGLNHQQYVTMLPKSITTAIGMGLADEMGGLVTITVASIIITGILGNMMAELICKIFRITEPVAKGIAIGTAAHAVGTAKALEMGEIEGAMSSLAIAVAGLLTVIMASFYANIM